MKATALVFCLLSQMFVGHHVNAQTLNEMAIVGHVLAVKDYSQQGPISEHAPMWRIASVQVLNAPVGTVIDVFFSGSEDIEWSRFPKLKVGDTGTMVLQPDSPITGQLQPDSPGTGQWLLVKFTSN